MSYLRKKLQAIMACADFKGYLREVTGAPPLTLTDCMGSDLVSLSVTGNAVQNGTPSPDAPVEVQGCGERTRNLFDVSNFTSNSDGYVENGSIYVMGYPYQPGITPEDFLEMTGLKEGDTFTSVADYTQVLSPSVLRVTNIQFLSKPSAPEDISTIVVFGNEGRLNTTTIPTGFNSDNFYRMYIYGGTSTGEGVRAIWSNLAIYKGSYTTDTMPPFEPYGYKVPVKVGGINLFDVSQLPARTSGYVQDGAIYVTGYPYQTGVTPEKFLAMTGLKEGDTFTMVADYEQVFQTSSGVTNIQFIKRPSAPAELSSIVIIGNRGALRTTTIPEGFNSDNYYGMYIYGGSGTPEAGQVRAIYRNLRVYKGTYAADTMPAYEPYHEPQAVNVYTDKPLYAVGGAGDTITLDFDAKTATRTDKTAEIKAYNNEPISGEYVSSTGSLTEGAQVIYALSEPVTVDISDLQNWDEAPSLWRGTATVSAETAVQPSSMTARYYATQKED